MTEGSTVQPASINGFVHFGPLASPRVLGIVDNVVELLVMAGRSLPHALMMLIPEAWAGNPLMEPERKAFYDTGVDQTTKFILTAIRIATPAQKKHAQERMQGWINDFQALAAGK